jgi:hypothetical protein
MNCGHLPASAGSPSATGLQPVGFSDFRIRASSRLQPGFSIRLPAVGDAFADAMPVQCLKAKSGSPAEAGFAGGGVASASTG